MAVQVETQIQTPLRLGAFAIKDWALLAGTALTWGSSFVLIEVGLQHFKPALITLLRLLFGMAAIIWVKRARQPIQRSDWGAVAVVGVLWMAIPFLLFPIAQQWIDSSLAGMINGAVPIVAALVATIGARKLPGIKQSAGLIIGFAGVVTVSWLPIQGAHATATGALLVMLATVCYGIALNVMAPLQRKYGALPVLLRVQTVALVLTLGPGLVAAGDSTFSWTSLASVVPLGCLGTGLAFLWMATLVGRVGASRASVTIYFIPIVAIVLGALLRDESIALLSLLGTAFVLAGAYLASRGEHS